MIYVAYDINTYSVYFASVCTNEEDTDKIFKKFVLPSLKVDKSEIKTLVLNVSAILEDMHTS